MQKTIKAICFLTCLFFGSQVLAQTASILPLGVTQFFDNNGDPLAGGKVYNYIPGTTTFKTTWQDSAEVTANANPVILDSAGRAKIYGQGAYRQIVRKSNNDLVWDAVTSSTGSGGGSASTGDGDLVGTVKPWAGLTAPNQYAFAYGQELSRTTYSSLLTAVTLSTNVTCTSASNTLSGMSDTSSVNIGAAVEASCVPSGSLVVSKTSSSITLNNPASLTITAVAVIFPFGNGNGTSTFNLPDLRGYVLAGRDNMGGTAAARLTTTYYGANTPDALGATGGSQSTTIAQANLPAATLTTTISAGQGSHTHTATTNAPVASAQGTSGPNNLLVTGTATITVNSATLPQMTGTTPLGGSGTAISRIQPSITMNYIIKITPDTNSSVATGVTDIEGMVGSIACGSTLLCTGNEISVNPNSLRVKLTQDTTYNVPADFASFCEATDYLSSYVDGASHNVIIQLADGTYTNPICYFRPFIGINVVTIRGNTGDKTAVRLAIASGGSIFQMQEANPTQVRFEYVEFDVNTGVPALGIYHGNVVGLDNISWMASTGTGNLAIATTVATTVALTGNHSFASLGTTSSFAFSGDAAFFSFEPGFTGTVVGTPAYSIFLEGRRGGIINGSTGVTWVNGASATGLRYALFTDAILDLGGSTGALPGNVEFNDGTATYNTAANKIIVPLPVSTVNNLPTCNGNITGAKYLVYDNATAISFGAVITTGGALVVPVFCNGTDWRQG